MSLFHQPATAFRTPQLLATVTRNIRRQKKFIAGHIIPEIEAAKKANDGSLDEESLKKITQYYGLAVPAVLGEAFCALRGRKMTERERLASTCQGATTGLFDDFFDKQDLSGETLKKFIETPLQMKGANASQQLFLNLYIKLLQNLPHPELLQAAVNRVYAAQVESKKQVTPGISFEEMRSITLQKGGASLLLYRTAFDHPVEKREEEMLFKLGGLMQLSNDIFDVYKDCRDGISTLVTTAEKISDIRNLFISLWKEGNALARLSNYQSKNIEQFLDILSICIFSRSRVCLDHLEKNEKGSGNVFAPLSYDRKALVCDMDTALNKWKSVKYHVGKDL